MYRKYCVTSSENAYYTVCYHIYFLASDKQYAFITDSFYLEYVSSQAPCQVHMVGRFFNQFGYGLALQKGSPFTEQFTLAILKFRSNGLFDRLKKTWLNAGACTHTGEYIITPIFV